MHWAMIVVFGFSGGLSTDHVDFQNQALCEAAAARLMGNVPESGEQKLPIAYAYCVRTAEEPEGGEDAAR